MTSVRVLATAAELHAAAAHHITAAAARAAAERGRFLFVLAGGSTPRGVYERLAAEPRDRIDWARVHLFWGDERCVPPDHPKSNYAMVAGSLLRHVAIPPGNLHRIRGEDAAYLAAARHGAELAEFFGRASPDAGGAGPTFDLVLLGLGADGHTASLFPGSPALDATGWVVAARAPGSGAGAERVTLTLPAINSAREGVFLVVGAAKRGVVRQLFRAEGVGSRDPPLPAARVRPRGGALWLLDGAAGAGFQT